MNLLSLFLKRKVELGFTFGYLLLLILFHWQLNFDWSILFFLGGGILGVYFLDLADLVFKIEPKPYRNVFFQTAFILMTLFIITSSGSLMGAGLVLSIYLNMILSQFKEIQEKGNLDEWFKLIKREVDIKTQKIYLGVISGAFLLLNLLFL